MTHTCECGQPATTTRYEYVGIGRPERPYHLCEVCEDVEQDMESERRQMAAMWGD